jgi:hypothetical protein
MGGFRQVHPALGGFRQENRFYWGVSDKKIAFTGGFQTRALLKSPYFSAFLGRFFKRALVVKR